MVGDDLGRFNAPAQVGDRLPEPGGLDPDGEARPNEEAVRKARKRLLWGSLFIPIGLVGVWTIDSWFYTAFMGFASATWAISAYREYRKPNRILAPTPWEIISRVLKEDQKTVAEATGRAGLLVAAGEGRALAGPFRAERVLAIQEDLDRLDRRGSV